MNNSNLKHIDDWLFDGKNKDYGAFVLRKKVNKNLLIGTISGVFLLVIIYFVPILIRWIQNKEPEIQQVQVEITPYSELMAPPPIPTEPKPPEPIKEPLQVATKKFVKPELKPDELVKEEELIPTIVELKEANPGTKTQEGTGDIHIDYKPVIAPPPPPPPPPPPKEEIYTYVEIFPSFPGGEVAMQKFIADNIYYPTIAVESGIQGVVVVQFVVNPEGRIIDPVVVRDIGGGCGEEAIKVVKKMPRWTPGEQNGRKVSVRYTLPVRFRVVQ